MELSINPNTETYSARFAELSGILAAHQEHWQGRAFVQPTLSWQVKQAGLSEYLLALPDELLIELESKPDELNRCLGAFFPELGVLPELLSLPEFEMQQLPDANRFFNRHIPGRKWQQLRRFSASAPYRGGHIVDWCSGKGHLARYYAGQHDCSGHCLELQQDLVDSGRQLGAEQSLSFHQCNVLEDGAAQWLKQETHALALHACGDLHRRLLDLVVSNRAKALSLAPCCYQKTNMKLYQPLSKLAMATGFELQRHDLHSAVQETVTAGRAVRERRQQLQAWRLGFDVWQRQWRGLDEYLHTPSQPQSVLKLGFESFCRLLAESSGLDLGEACFDWGVYEMAGKQRFARARRLDLLRLGFRRALEMWLVLDQVLFLQEHGYTVELGEFCERELSPRNLLLNAWR